MIVSLAIFAAIIFNAVILYDMIGSYYVGSFFPISVFITYFVCVALILPALARRRVAAIRILIVYYPLMFCYLCLYNHTALVFSTAAALLLAIVLPREKRSAELIFTEDGAAVLLKKYKRRGVYDRCVVFSLHAAALLLVFSFIFQTPTVFWQVNRFPVDLSRREFDSPAVASGAVTLAELWDGDAILVADFFDIGDTKSPAKAAGLMPNDVVTEINGKGAMQSDFIKKEPDGSPVNFKVMREAGDGFETKFFTVTPVYSAEDSAWRVGMTYYSGAYLYGSVQTLSFFYPESGRFAATAHESSEFTSVENMSGELYSAKVTSFDEEGLSAEPLAYIGDVDFSDKYGSFGTLESVEGKEYPICEKRAVRFGKAKLLSAFEGGDVKEYDVFITGTYRISGRDVLTLIVTDERIRSVGGVRRGMSGSPIVQNGKIIGALSNMDAGGVSAYATFAADMAHELKLLYEEG